MPRHEVVSPEEQLVAEPPVKVVIDPALAALPPPRPVAVAGGGANPIVAALISLFLPGVGQIYAGEVGRGVVILVIALFTCGLFGLINLIAAADAYMLASTHRSLGSAETR